MSVSTSVNTFVPALVNSVLLNLQHGNTLPFITGTWFFVDPRNGSDTTGDGMSVETAVASLGKAYDLCTTNLGDGICLLSSDATTTDLCTSYIKSPMDWSKNSITVFGACAPTRFAQRSRISNQVKTSDLTGIAVTMTAHTVVRASGSFITDGWVAGMTGTVSSAGTASTNNAATFTVTEVAALTLTFTETFTAQTAAECGTVILTSHMASMITVSGHNNAFYNVHITHTGAQASDVNCLKVTGTRNYFKNVHAGAGLASAASIVVKSLWLAAAEENTFEGCTFGLDTVNRGNNATYDILIAGVCKRNIFVDCLTIGYASTGVAKMAVYLSGTVGGSPTIFKNCTFLCNNVTEMTAAFGATGSNDKVWCVSGTCHPGYAALGGGANVVWIVGPTASTAGVSGKATSPAA